MKFLNLNGREISVDVRPSKYPRRDKDACRSEFQWRIGQLIDKVYPSVVILEDFYLPGEGLYLDYLIPLYRIAVEADGVQHSSYSAFFHGTPEKYKKAVVRDTNKEHWCELNGIKLIRIAFNDKENEILEKLRPGYARRLD